MVAIVAVVAMIVAGAGDDVVDGVPLLSQTVPGVANTPFGPQVPLTVWVNHSGGFFLAHALKTHQIIHST